MMNMDTLGVAQNEPSTDGVQQEVYAIIDDAWRTVTEADNNVTSMLSFIISRTERCSFTRQFSQLQARVNEIASSCDDGQIFREGYGCSSLEGVS
ncbi:hypothetical protein ACF3VQ_03575 [Yersinia sp. HM-2024]|uniref:hypothetical protein n=1 Tax=Yersinia sp. HM-2024 TaxID=3344550 RepID=UPI00370D3D87